VRLAMVRCLPEAQSLLGRASLIGAAMNERDGGFVVARTSKLAAWPTPHYHDARPRLESILRPCQWSKTHVGGTVESGQFDA
jgi:hypothetical protein